MQRVAELAKSAAVQKLGKLDLDAEHRRSRDAEHRTFFLFPWEEVARRAG